MNSYIRITLWEVTAHIEFSIFRFISIYIGRILKIAMLPQYGQRICFCFIKIHLAYVFYTYIVRKQVMNSHRMGIETTPRFGLNGTKWQKI